MDKAQGIIDKCNSRGRSTLSEWEAREVLDAYQIPVVESRVAKDLKEGKKYASRLGFPVVLKILSPDIQHKSDLGAVELNISSEEEFEGAWQRIEKNVKGEKEAQIDGMLVQKMAPSGVELILGVTNDQSFGPVLLIGLGGVFVEIFKDISLRLLPVDRAEARAMIEEIKGYPLLTGARGREPADLDCLMDTMLKVSSLVTEIEEIKELDINPFILYPEGGVAADALITI